MKRPTAGAVREAFLSDIKTRLFEESIPRIKACLERLTTDQIWWRPNDHSNSIGNLILHLDGNVRQWILSGIAGRPDTRRRQSEFDTGQRMTGQALFTLLDKLQDDTKPVIDQVSVTELTRKRPVQIYEETGAAILVHVTEHFSYHTGQIAYITKMLLNEQLGFYDDSLL